MSKTAQAIKSGVVMGGTAILSAVNGLTPHMAGAIDIMVVQQPDGSLKCSPFYVRFGKYTPMRSKDKKVKILVNGEEACFSMHLGAYGQAYFAAETMEIVSDADDELLTGMMSPSSGYSSDEDEDSMPYANAAMLTAVQQEVARIQGSQHAAAAVAAGTGAGSTQRKEAAAAADPDANATAAEAAQGCAILSGSESDTESSSSSLLSDLPSPSEVAAALQQGLAAVPAVAPSTAAAAAGQELVMPPGLPPIATSSSNGSTGPGPRRRSRQHVAKRVLQVSGDGAAGDPARAHLQDLLLDNKYSFKMQSDESFSAGQHGPATQQQPGQKQQQRREQQHDHSPLQHGSRVAEQEQVQQQVQQQAQQKVQQQQQQQQQQQECCQQQPSAPVRHVGFQLPSAAQQLSTSEGGLKDAPFAAAADGHGDSSSGISSSAAEAGSSRDDSSSGSNNKQNNTNSSTLTLANGNASAAVAQSDKRTVAPGSSSSSSSSGSFMESQPTLSDGLPAVAQPAEQPAAAFAVAPAAAPTAAAAAADVSVAVAVDGRHQPQEEVLISPSRPRDSLLSSSLRAQQHTEQLQQQGEQPGRQKQPHSQAQPRLQQEQQQQPQHQQPEAVHEVQALQPPEQQQQQQQGQSQRSQQQEALAASQQQRQQPEQAGQQPERVDPPVASAGVTAASAPVQPEARAADSSAAAAAVAVEGAASVASSQGEVDATAILDDAAAIMPSGWGMHPAAAQQQQQYSSIEPADSSTTSSSAVQQSPQPQPPQQPPSSDGVAAAAAEQPSATTAQLLPHASPQQQQQQQQQQVTAGDATAVDLPAAAAASAPRSDPVNMPAPFAASPPVDSGYLGDCEAGALLGTSCEGATPRPAAAASEGMAGPGAGPLALGFAGFQLSLCGELLRPGMPAAEAQQVFEMRRVSGQMWSERGVSLMSDPDLVVRVGGSLYSWQVAAPMVVGMLAFGGKWDSLLGLDPTGIYPIKVAEEHAAHAAKKSSSSSSWRLWPFGGWREPSSGRQQQPHQAGVGASPPLPPAAAGASASATTLTPSGGSFTNLMALLGPGSKSAPNRVGDVAGAGTGGSTGGTVDAGAAAVVPAADASTGRSASFLSTGSSPPRASRKKHIILIRKTLTPTSDQLSLLPLQPGANTITFRAGGAADLTAYIYLLRWNTRLVVSDVDGTITRSDLLGHVLPTLGVDWSHPGITQLFHNIARNGYQIMFLSSRAIAQANITREYLHSLVQNDFKMPSGPVIISPHGLLPSLYREIVVRRPHEFKIACLQDIRALFPPDWNPFYAGFGNRDTDEVAYREVGVPLSRTFTINPKGQIQKASTAVQSSTWSSLSAINDLVDEMFPALLQHNSSSLNARALHSVYTSFTETLELAAAIGAIEQEQADAACAEQQRRHSSSGSPSEGAAGSGGGAEGAAAGAGAGAGGVTAAGGAAGGDGGDVVGPAREEFNDLHYWRPTLYLDLEEELAAAGVSPVRAT